MKRALFASFVLGTALVLGLAVSRYAPFTREAPLEPVSGIKPAAQSSAFPLALHRTPRAVPAIRFQDGTGRPMGLADFRGRVVLLNVWATWCPPCRKEMPSLDRLQLKLGGPDFEVVALSIDHEGVAAVQQFYKEVGIRALKIYIDPTTDAAGRLGILGIPGTLLIDRRGQELGRALGPAEWDSAEAIALVQQALGGGAEPTVAASPSTENRFDSQMTR